MKRILLALLVLVVAGLVVFTALGLLWDRGSDSQPINHLRLLGEVRGFTVQAGEGGEFPARPAMTQEELKAQLDELVAFAKSQNFNSILFQVQEGQTVFYRSKALEIHPDMAQGDTLFSKFDPLEYLCTQAAAQQVQVLAVLDGGILSTAGGPEQAAQLGAELAKQYPLGGVVLDQVDAALGEDILFAAVSQLGEGVQKAGRGIPLGLMFDTDPAGISPRLITLLTQGGRLQLVIPRLTTPVDGADGGYRQQLHRWLDAAKGEAKLYTGGAAYLLTGSRPDLEPYADPEELNYQLFLGSVTPGISGVVLESYRDLLDDRADLPMLMSFLSQSRVIDPLDGQNLVIPQTLKITYPESPSFRTSGSSIFLMGTSDPGQELTLDGEPVERLSFGGTFGVKLDLKLGSNWFVFRQGTQTASVEIIRYTPSTTPVPITTLVRSSLFPQVPHGVQTGETITLSCTAPSGAAVTAVLGGQSITLKQTAQAAPGVPARYQGELTLPADRYPAGATTNIGRASYTLHYNGINSTFTSAGDTLVAGSQVPVQLRLTAHLANVLEHPDKDDTVTATLREHAVVRTVGKVRTTREGAGTIAYQLEGGGYVLGDNIEVVEGAPVPRAQVTAISTQLTDQGEILLLTPDTPAVVVTREEGQLVLDFYDTDITADPDLLTSGFFDRMTTETADFGSRLTLRLREGAQLWGYNVEYTEAGLQLYLKRPPTRSRNPARPLEGITVMVDPGHGGSDPGALGITFGTGPDEADLNLAAALAAKYRLEQLGATVLMTRMDDLTPDGRYTVTQRNIQADGAKPDLFISFHHNSANLTSDLNQRDWMECYYFEDFSRPLAQNLLDRLKPAVGRTAQDPAWARFYVTRLTFAPSVLLELGYMVNPINFEDATQPLTIYKTACAIARAVVDTIPPAPEQPVQ